MKLTPCEYIVWHGLPVLRKEIARSMINDFGLKEVEAAKKLGISASAISQYLSGKRAKDEITNVEILKEIKKSARRLLKNGDEAVIPEICRICRIFSSKKLCPFVCDDNESDS